MKKLFLILILWITASVAVFSQNEFGFKAGLSSYDLAERHIANTSDLKFGLKILSMAFMQEYMAGLDCWESIFSLRFFSTQIL
ncbi:MAG: hypothetical protein IPH57_04165 [Saprospiraceae bacterium]|nr:hypothetical protein [Saprospiraceae bacterium]